MIQEIRDSQEERRFGVGRFTLINLFSKTKKEVSRANPEILNFLVDEDHDVFAS